MGIIGLENRASFIVEGSIPSPSVMSIGEIIVVGITAIIVLAELVFAFIVGVGNE